MRHYRCPTCQQQWDLEESTVLAHGATLVCPACSSPLTATSAVAATPEEPETAVSWLGERFLGAPMADSLYAAVARFVLVGAVAWASIPLFSLPMKRLDDHYWWLDRVNLVFHEAGHWIFGVFGSDFLHSLGGTLGQLLMPLILAIAFFVKNRDCFATALGTWWVGENLVDISVYVNDARSLSLTLIGGKTGKEVHGHDWEYMLTELGLINQDIYIARGVLLAGRIIMALGLLWMLAVIARSLALKLAKH